jgi:hypothetical protein
MHILEIAGATRYAIYHSHVASKDVWLVLSVGMGWEH